MVSSLGQKSIVWGLKQDMDMGQPTWAYRPVNDLPAASAYARYQLLPHPQHVRGDKGE